MEKTTNSPKLIHAALIVVIFLLVSLYTITSFNNTYSIQAGYNDELQMPAKTHSFKSKPRKQIQPSDNQNKPLAKHESLSESFWSNLMDARYSSSYRYDGGSDFEPGESWIDDNGSDFETGESWKDIMAQMMAASTINSDKESSCPERRPVVISDDGQRQIPKELYNMAKQVFDTVPTQFLQNTRNPCWQRDTDIFCLPYFFLAGFPKSGTTDLWDKLVCHPAIMKTHKEPHWWPRSRIGGRKTTVQQYSKKYYSRISRLLKSPSMEVAAKNAIFGDGSASTFWDSRMWQSFFNITACKDEGPPYVIADIIHTVLPNTKIIVIMRNPTERLYSGYMFFNREKLKTKKDASTFHAEVMSEIDAYNKCLKNASNRTCAYATTDVGSTKKDARLHIGLYSIYVRDWLKVFPPKQLMFLRLEDWHDSCPEILPQIFRFLELAPLPGSTISGICARQAKNPTKRHRDPMLEKTRRILDDFYSKTKQDLAYILNDDRFLWK